MYTTKATKMAKGYGCRVFQDGKLILEGRCDSRDLIGPTFRDFLRTIDRLGGDQFTSAVRNRVNTKNLPVNDAQHYWPDK